MKKRNPFVICGYNGPETFCDREIELQKLRNAVANGRNITLLAERRIGKTGLIRHLFNGLSMEDACPCIYVDIFATSNLAEFTARFAEAIIGSLDSQIDKAIEAASRFFKGFRPGITIDIVTGAPTVSFGLQPQIVESTLKECFAYLGKHGNCVVAIDEFQQIANYPEKGVEAMLRSYVQFLPEVRFVFAGSRHHMMAEMFSSAKRPFYNSTQTLPLDRIDREKYYLFAKRFMDEISVDFSYDVFVMLYSMFDGSTWYVQTVMNRLYERQSATEKDVRSVVEDLIHEKSWEFATVLNSLPEGAQRLVKAVAKEGKVKEITSGSFIAAHSLKGSSSVHLSLKRLIDDEVLYRCEDGYVVYDRLFGFWLSRL